MKKLLTITALSFIVFATIAPASVANAAKNWNANPSVVTAGTAGGLSPEKICEQLFRGDPNNIFREVLCSLVNIVALSIADFSTELTCEIQKTGYSSNYQEGASFTFNEGSGQCNTDFVMPPDKSQLTSSILSGEILRGFKIARGIMTVISVAFLFFLAFANILHININTYSVKRALPMLVVAVIGGYLAIYIVFLLSFLADSLLKLQIFSPEQALHPISNVFGGYLGKQFIEDITSGTAKNSVNLVFDVGKVLTSSTQATFITGTVGSILLLIPAIVVFVFEYVLALRPFVIQILTIASPIVFASLILPQTQFIFRKWWSFLLIAIFYAPLTNFIFYGLNSIPFSGENIAILTLWAVKIVAIFFLVRFPFTIESDLKKIGIALSKTDFGASIGLNKIIKAPPQQLKTDISGLAPNQKLSGAESQGLIVPVKMPLPDKGSGDRIPTRARIVKPLITNIKDIVNEAHQANLKRTPDLMIRSATDIPTDTIREIMQNSDIKIWKDEQTLNQLKNQKGQVLNEAGAALRADSVRKLVRLSEVVDNNSLTNPQAIKFLSQKGALDQLPLYILKKAFDDKIISAPDIQKTFGANTPGVISRLNQMSAATTFAVNSKNIAKVEDTDQKDFATGFKDIRSAMNSIILDPVKISSTSGKNILESMKKVDKNAVNQNGLYYLERLGQQSRASQQEISKTLQREGVPAQTAGAIAQNTNVNSSNIGQYLTGKTLSDDAKRRLTQNFASRDLTNSIAGEIASSVSQEKTLVGKTIAGKISESLNQGKDLGSIKTEVSEAVGKIARPTSPEDTQKSIEGINKYYPGTQVAIGREASSQDIEKTIQHGKNILETIDTIEKGGVSEDEAKTNLPAVEKKIEGQVNSTIRKVASGAIASDSAFDSKISNIITPKKT